MVFIAQSKRECRWDTLELGFLVRDLDSLTLTISLSLCHSAVFLVKEFYFLNVFCFSAMFADKNQVALRLNFTNVATLNYLLRSEIFVSKDGQLRVVHLILEFDPISKIFQEIGHVIRVGDP